MIQNIYIADIALYLRRLDLCLITVVESIYIIFADRKNVITGVQTYIIYSTTKY